MSDAATPEPAPQRGGRSCTILVVEKLLRMKEGSYAPVRGLILDLAARDRMGFEKYGQNLETHDGRDTAMDLYQEILDACQYATKCVAEGRPAPAHIPYDVILSTLLRIALALREGLDAGDSGVEVQ